MAIAPADLIDCVARMNDAERARLCELLDPIALPDSGPLPGEWDVTEAKPVVGPADRTITIRPVGSEVGLLAAEAQPGGTGRQRTLSLRDVIAPRAVFEAFLGRYGDVTKAAGNHLRFYAPGTPDGAELKHCVLSSVGMMVEAGDMLHAAGMTLIYTESLPIVPASAYHIPMPKIDDSIDLDPGHVVLMGTVDGPNRNEEIPGPAAFDAEGPPPPEDPPSPEFLEAVKWFQGPLDHEMIRMMWRGWLEASQASPPADDALLKVADWIRGWSDGSPAGPAPPLTAFAKVGDWLKGQGGIGGSRPGPFASGPPAPLGLVPVTRQLRKSTALVEVSADERARRAREHDHNVAEGNARQTRWARAEARWRAAFPGEEGVPMAVAAVDLGVAIDVALNQIDAMLYDKEHKGVDPARCACGCGMVIGCGGTRKVVVDTPDGPEFRDADPFVALPCEVYAREPKHRAVFERVATPAEDPVMIATYVERWAKAHERWRLLFGGEKIPMNTMALPAAAELERVESMLHAKELLGVDPDRCPCGCGHVIGCRVP
jgi:hypothetical protein